MNHDEKKSPKDILSLRGCS